MATDPARAARPVGRSGRSDGLGETRRPGRGSVAQNALKLGFAVLTVLFVANRADGESRC